MSTSRGADTVAVALPAGLASMVPGPQLGVLLSSVDRSRVGGEELPDLVAARARLAAHTEAELLADLWEAARGILAEPQDGLVRYTEEELIDHAARVLGWVLHCSESYAYGRVMLGRALVVRLPMVLAALRAGHIDSGKARVIVEALAAVVDDDLARVIAGKVLRRAGVQTMAQVRAGLRYHIDRNDPGAARRRYQKRVVQRSVYVHGNDDGTATLSAVNLPPQRAAQAYDRIDRLARCARAGGDARNLHQLRADAALDILAGVPFQLAPTVDPLTHQADLTTAADLTAAAGADFPDPDEPTDPQADRLCEVPGRVDADEHDWWYRSDEDRWCIGDRDQRSGPAASDDQCADGPTMPAPARPQPPDPGATRNRIDAGGAELAGNSGDAREAESTGNSCSANRNPAPDGTRSAEVLAGDRCGCGGVLPDLRRGTVDVQVKLTTLIGLDEHPGLIAGLDTPILADLARHLAFDPDTRPVWRWSIIDEHGDLLHHGITGQRPGTDTRQPNSCFATTKPAAKRCRCPRVQPGARRSTIEVQLTPATLAQLVDNPGMAPGYEQVVADIAAQAAADAELNPSGKWSEVDEHGQLKHHGHTGRMPDAVEEAFIRARDRTCRTPGCPVPSRRCELDHRIEHATGGPSHRGCVDARCRRHHHLRDRTGFTISKQGTITRWTIPCGRSFDVTTDGDIILTED